jgi:hypothetical protein
MAKKIIRLTESELVNLVSKILKEEALDGDPLKECIKKQIPNFDKEVPQPCIELFKSAADLNLTMILKNGFACAKGLGLTGFNWAQNLKVIYDCYKEKNKGGYKPPVMY